MDGSVLLLPTEAEVGVAEEEDGKEGPRSDGLAVWPGSGDQKRPRSGGEDERPRSGEDQDRGRVVVLRAYLLEVGRVNIMDVISSLMFYL